MSTVLSRIADAVRTRLEMRMRERSMEELEGLTRRFFPPQSLRAVLAKEKPSVIAEIKFRSPSQGVLKANPNPSLVARDYIDSGASALSILTEQDYFGGQLEFLTQVRTSLPDASLLMKDFIFSEYQILEGYLAGADTVLLIVALLGEARAAELLHFSRTLRMEALVEVHDEGEMSAAKHMGASLIGINNRDLHTLEISLDVSRRMAKLAPVGCTLVCESGIQTRSQLLELHELGFDSFLIGSSLMKSDQPGLALRTLLGRANP